MAGKEDRHRELDLVHHALFACAFTLGGEVKDRKHPDDHPSLGRCLGRDFQRKVELYCLSVRAPVDGPVTLEDGCNPSHAAGLILSVNGLSNAVGNLIQSVSDKLSQFQGVSLPVITLGRSQEDRVPRRLAKMASLSQAGSEP